MLEESASAAMTSNCPTSGSEDPIPGLAKTVKRLAVSNFQIISCYSVLGPTLWYENFQSPEKYAWAMIAALLSLRAGLSLWLKAEQLIFLFPERLVIL